MPPICSAQTSRLTSSASAKEAADLAVILTRITAKARHDSPPAADAALKLMREMTPLGTWPDLNYADQANGKWSPTEHLSRLQRLAQAYALPKLGDGQANPNFESAPLLPAILRAYDAWFSVLPAGTPRALAKPGNAFKDDLTTPTSRNWWHNEIGVPLKMTAILLLLQGKIDGERLEDGLAILTRSSAKMDSSGINTGANRSWRAHVVTARAALTQNAALLREMIPALEENVQITTGTGIQADYSFWQHGPQLYLLGYGQGTALDMTELGEIYRGTGFAFRPEFLETLTNLTLEGYQWAMRGSVGDYNAMGRGIANPRRDDAANLVIIADRLLASNAPRRIEIEAFRGRLRREPNAAPLSGNRAFWRSGWMSHQRPNYGVSVRVSPEWLIGGEVINGQGQQSRYTGDGVTFLMRSGDEYRNLSPVLNFRLLPGVTGALAPEKPKMPGPYVGGVGRFAGGASDGTYGAVGYDYARDGVAARKSWFFFDDEYACLGAGISADASVKHPLVTSIEQRRSALPFTRSPDGAAGASWIAHDGGATVVLDRTATIQARVGAQTGSWRDVNSDSTDKSVVKESVFSLYLDHGVAPKNASYAYIVVPQIAADKLPVYAAKPPLQILANTPQLQAVRHAGLNLTQAVFHAPGTLQIAPNLRVTASRACVLLLQNPANGASTLTVADPNNPPGIGFDDPSVRNHLPAPGPAQTTAPLEIEVSIPLSGVGATRIDADKTRLSFALPTGMRAGQSLTQTFRPVFEPPF